MNSLNINFLAGHMGIEYQFAITKLTPNRADSLLKRSTFFFF